MALLNACSFWKEGEGALCDFVWVSIPSSPSFANKVCSCLCAACICNRNRSNFSFWSWVVLVREKHERERNTREFYSLSLPAHSLSISFFIVSLLFLYTKHFFWSFNSNPFWTLVLLKDTFWLWYRDGHLELKFAWWFWKQLFFTQ